MRRFSSLLPLLLVLLLASCASQLRDTGNLDGGYAGGRTIDRKSFQLSLDSSVFNTGYIGHLDEKKMPEEPAFLTSLTIDDGYTTRPVVFVIPEPLWLAGQEYSPESGRQEEIIFTLRERLYRYILRSYPHPVRVRYAMKENDVLLEGYRPITVTARVTDVRKGNGFSRYFFGWGAGQTYIQIEGEIFDGPEGVNKIGEYAIRRAHGGYAQNGLNVQVLKSHYCLRYAVDEAVLELSQTLAERIPGIEIVPGKKSPVADIYELHGN